jgi:hypothetical protein
MMTASVGLQRIISPMFAQLCFASIALSTVIMAAAAAATTDQGKKACAVEAKALCPSEMRSFSRKRVEACMIARIDQTSPTCHEAMLRIKAQRGA